MEQLIILAPADGEGRGDLIVRSDDPRLCVILNCGAALVGRPHLDRLDDFYAHKEARWEVVLSRHIYENNGVDGGDIVVIRNSSNMAF